MKLLSPASGDILTFIDQVGWMQKFDHGEPVIWEGDICEAIYFVSVGAVEIYRNAIDGREHTLTVMQPGDSFNLVPALTDNGENVANVRCIQPCELLLVGKADFNMVLSRYPDFSNTVLKEIASRLAGMTRKAGELALFSVRQRLANFLIKEAVSANQGNSIYWTRDDIARQIATVRDVVTRHLRLFEEHGLIKRDKGSIRLIARKGLEDIAAGQDTT